MAAQGSDLAAVHNNLGLSYFENDMFSEAEKEFQQALVKEDPNRTQERSFYLKNSGLAKYHQGMMDAALEDYKQAIQLNGTNADGYFNRGNVYLYQAGQLEQYEMYDKAHEDFDTAIGLDPTNAKLYHAKGLVYQEQSEVLFQNPEQFDEKNRYIQLAIEQFSNALSCEKTFASSMFHKGLMYRRIQEYTAALQLFTEVLNLLENDETVLIQRGLVYQDMGNHSLAIDDFNKAITEANKKQN